MKSRPYRHLGHLEKFVACLALLLGVSCAARAQEPLDVYMLEVPPIASKDPLRHGVAGEIAIEALRRARLPATLMTVPNNRAILAVGNPASRDQLIIGLGRVPEREANFTWIAPLYKVDRAFYMLDRQIGSFAQARATLRAVAVMRGTVGVLILRENGFKSEQIHEVRDGGNFPKMLSSGIVDAWFGPIEQMEIHLQGMPHQERIRRGPVVTSTVHYLACSKQCSPALVTSLAGELARMEADNTNNAIRARYGAGKSAPVHGR